ncbi:unnamed protein product [Mycena citricolor]|uniref:Myb-like domain-containing protein n=1 Tax=Mycena citricolor TaxID=2018698 RepID=A0AAD2GYH3_9AGAR|nr:unnamed protein product [Mycena citricolor]
MAVLWLSIAFWSVDCSCFSLRPMTSRVQKGGPVFRPVVNARSRAGSAIPKRAAAENSLSTPDASLNGRPSDLSSEALSMPPPPLPSSTNPSGDQTSPDLPPPATTSVAVPIAAPSSSRASVPPSIVSTSSAAPPAIRATVAPPTVIRSTPVPPAIGRGAPVPPPIGRAAPAPQTIGRYSAAISTTPASTEMLPLTPTLVNPTPAASEAETSQLQPETSSVDPPEAAAAQDELTSPVKSKLRKRRRAVANVDTADDGDEAPKPKKRRKKLPEDGDRERPKAKRKSRKKNVETADGNEEENAGSDTPVRKRSRKKTTPVFDPEAGPGDEIDPTLITMADLCDDTGQGRISSKAMEIQKNHLAWKQQSKDKRAQMRALAERKKYGRPEEEDEDVANPAVSATDMPSTEPTEVIVGSNNDGNDAEVDDAAPVIEDESGNGFDYSQSLAVNRYAVQLRLGPNGQTIIDEDSLMVDRAEDVDTSNYEHVVESDATKFINSASYTKKCRGSRWSTEETELFFDALSQHGENYELISLMLPGRSRTACKNKFKAEDKKDTARINRCLESRIPVDIKSLTSITGRDFSGPVPVFRIPTPPPVAPKESQSVEPEGRGSSVRKRSRSRSKARQSGAEEGLEILGDIDSYENITESIV